MRIPRPAWAVVLYALVVQVALLAPAGTTADEPGRVFRIGLTPVFLDNKVTFLKAWRNYLQTRLGSQVEFVQRQTYREITELILDQKLDAAWVCGFPFVRNESRMRLLAVPVYQGEPLYQAYLIVPVSDTSTRDVTDLERRVFAYSDPDSNSGFLVPRVALARAGHDPGRFFRRSFFSWAHRDVVQAVAEGVADGGSVDGYVWDTLKLHRPDLVTRTRVVTRSDRYGFPPFVTPTTLPVPDFDALQRVMLEMADDPDGRRLLRELNLDGFVAGSPALFDGIREAVEYLDGG